MKTLFKTFAYAAIAALALSSCAKEKLQPADELTGKLVTVHFGTENTDPSTKATLKPNDGETAFQAAWENGDQILISYSYDGGNPSITTGTWKDNSFEASLTGGNGDWMYDAAYPVPAENNSVDFGSNRTQNGNAYNSKYDIMIGSAVATNAAAGKDKEGKDIVFKMDRQTAIAYFHFTSELDESLVSATLKVKDGAIANSAASITDFKFVAPSESDETEIKLTFEDGTAPSAKDFQLWFNVLPTSYSSMTLTVETDTKTFTISKKSKGLYEAGKLYKVKKDKEDISWTDKIFFYESFDQTSGTGGNDNRWSGSIASGTVVYDNEGWYVSNAGGASKCLKLGTGKQKGSATTPSLGITTSEATLSFKAAAWNASNEKTKINLSIIGAGTISPIFVNLAKGQWSEYECTITGADATTKIKFEAANATDNRFFIDEVYVYSGTTTAGSGSGEGGGEPGDGENVSYSIVFKTANSDGSKEISETTKSSTVVSEGIDYITSFTSYCSKAYYAGVKGVKLGSNSAAGTLEFNLADAVKNNVVSIKVETAKYSSDKGTITMYNGSTKLKSGIIPGDDYTHEFTSPTTVESLKFVTTEKRAYISKITITVGKIDSHPSAATGVKSQQQQ